MANGAPYHFTCCASEYFNWGDFVAFTCDRGDSSARRPRDPSATDPVSRRVIGSLYRLASANLLLDDRLRPRCRICELSGRDDHRFTRRLIRTQFDGDHHSKQVSEEVLTDVGSIGVR